MHECFNLNDQLFSYLIASLFCLLGNKKKKTNPDIFVMLLFSHTHNPAVVLVRLSDLMAEMSSKA